MAAEVCDWHRLPTAGSFGAFCGLVPITHLSVWVPRTLSDQLERVSGTVDQATTATSVAA